ncbi:hypothetical protein NW767_014751 [Fusarium falciforme]|nr:hypothetical protein NW767_014751 [Fusarium falciforme]
MFPVATPKDILPFPLPGYLGKPLMLEAWKGRVVEVNEHNAAALVAVVDALGPDVLRGTPHFRRQVCSASTRGDRVNRLPTLRAVGVQGLQMGHGSGGIHPSPEAPWPR